MHLRRAGRAGDDGNVNLRTHLLRESQGRTNKKLARISVRRSRASADPPEAVQALGFPEPGEEAQRDFLLSSIQSSSKVTVQSPLCVYFIKNPKYKPSKRIKLQPETSFVSPSALTVEKGINPNRATEVINMYSALCLLSCISEKVMNTSIVFGHGKYRRRSIPSFNHNLFIYG